MPLEDTTTPLTSETIESLSPVFSIVCADAISDYQGKKAERGDPSSALELARKLKACVYESAIKTQGTPCNELQQSYKDCLAKGKRVPCQQLKAQLEECAIKHIGKLDG